MTTNRANSIDRTFKSRIHLTLQYPDLSIDTKEHIWRRFVGQSAEEDSITDQAYTRLAQLPINGREIKNTIKCAAMLAKKQDTSVGVDQIGIVLRATGEITDLEI